MSQIKVNCPECHKSVTLETEMLQQNDGKAVCSHCFHIFKHFIDFIFYQFCLHFFMHFYCRFHISNIFFYNIYDIFFICSENIRYFLYFFFKPIYVI